MKKLSTIIALFLISLLSGFSQDYPIEKVGSVECYVYTVEAGDGLYRISKRFGVLQSEIYKVNPNLDEGIKAGQTIYIPVNDANRTKPKAKAEVVEHRVVAKETLYSISKMYGVQQEDILRLNPSIEGTNIKVGEVLRIPVSDKNIRNVTSATRERFGNSSQQKQGVAVDNQPKPQKKYVSYEVKNRKETLYSISKQFGVNINDIIEANPYAENGIKKGDILQIPIVEENIPKSSGQTSHVVQPKETIYGISKQYGISSEQLIAANPSLKDGLKIGDTIIIPIQAVAETNITAIAATNEPASTQATAQKKSPVERAKRTYRIVYLLPFSASADETSGTGIDRFVDFYRGSLLALQKLKSDGNSFEVYTFDTQLGTDKVNEVLTKMPASVDLIIGPAYPKQVSIVSEYAKKRNINQLVPFTSKVSSNDMFLRQYQFNPSSADLDNKVAANILESNNGASYFFINFPNTDAKEYSLPANMKNRLKRNSVKYTEVDASTMTAQQFQQIIKSKSVVVLSACTTQEFDDFFTRFGGADCSKATFVLNEDNFDYAKENQPSIRAKEYLAYSLFNTNPSQEYLDSYNSYFRFRNPKYVPNYDLLGYDLTLYFCSALMPDRTFQFADSLELLQSTFSFVANSGNNTNTGCFLYHLRGNNLSVEKL